MHASSASPALYRIETLSLEGECLTVNLNPATSRGREPFAGLICDRASVTLLRNAETRSNHVALLYRVGTDEPLILPATVAMSIALSGQEAGANLYFAPPRPGMVRVSRSDASLAKQLAAMAESGDGAVFALEDGTFVTDTIAISGETAERWLGFTP